MEDQNLEFFSLKQYETQYKILNTQIEDFANKFEKLISEYRKLEKEKKILEAESQTKSSQHTLLDSSSSPIKDASTYINLIEKTWEIKESFKDEELMKVSGDDEDAEVDEEGYLRKEYIFGSEQVILYSMPIFRGTILDETVDFTGHLLWPGTYALNSFININKELFFNKTAIELGSGAGFSKLMHLFISYLYF